MTELVGPIQPIVKMQLFFVGHPIVLDPFKTGADPVLNFLFRYVQEFNSNFPAVGLRVGFNDLLKFPFLLLIEDATSF